MAKAKREKADGADLTQDQFPGAEPVVTEPVVTEPALDPLASMRVVGESDVQVEEPDTQVSAQDPAPPTVAGTDLGPSLDEEKASVAVLSSANIPPPLETEMVVQNDITISWGLQMIRLRPGQRVSNASYGDGALQIMMQAGVKLKYPDE